MNKMYTFRNVTILFSNPVFNLKGIHTQKKEKSSITTYMFPLRETFKYS